MFCFPDDLLLQCSESIPSTTYHSFVISEEGGRLYGVCATFWDRLPQHQQKQIDKLFKDWRSTELTKEDCEVSAHLKMQIAHEQGLIAAAKATLAASAAMPITPVNYAFSRKSQVTQEYNGILTQDECTAANAAISESEDKITLFKELLSSLDAMNCRESDVWMPRCIGFLSRWPWWDFFKDYLASLIAAVIGADDRSPRSTFPLERYVKSGRVLRRLVLILTFCAVSW